MGDADRLRKAGLRVTPARLAIMQIVRDGDHLDVDAVHRKVRERVGHVSLQAVYDALRALHGAGLVRKIEPMGSPARYESRVADDHHHVVCRRCGTVADVDRVTGHASCLTPADDAGYRVEKADVIFWGTCPACRAAAPAAS